MRVSLTARFIARPAIKFETDRPSGRRRRLGIGGGGMRYHRPLAARLATPTVEALRSQTSHFRFPSVGRIGRVSPRRGLLLLGLPRARRA